MPARLGAPGTRVGAELEARESQTPLQDEFLCPVLIVCREGINAGFTQADPGGQSGVGGEGPHNHGSL